MGKVTSKQVLRRTKPPDNSLDASHVISLQACDPEPPTVKSFSLPSENYLSYISPAVHASNNHIRV